MITAVMLGSSSPAHFTRRVQMTWLSARSRACGATGAVLDTITVPVSASPKNRFGFSENSRRIWRGNWAYSVYLIGEGMLVVSNTAMQREEARIRRITLGRMYRSFHLIVGNGEGQVKLRKLKSKVLRQKVKLTKVELEQLNGRLRTLQTKGMGMPKGVDPAKMKINRRALRGK